MFTKWSKGAVLGMSLLPVFIFTLTTSVIFNASTVWAETSEASDVAAETGGFFSGIMNWIKSVTDAVNEMWGMENGSGMAMVVNAAFYLILIVGVLFFGKMIFNILSSAINNKVDERYEKPSFRKK